MEFGTFWAGLLLSSCIQLSMKLMTIDNLSTLNMFGPVKRNKSIYIICQEQTV